MKVALVHDYLREYGEAEQVLRVLHQMYPEAPVYTAFVDRKQLGDAIAIFDDWDIRTAPSQQLPGIATYHQAFRPLLPYCWEALDLSAYDLVLSSSGQYLSKSVLTRSETLHISYCHTPPRDLWDLPQTNGDRHWYQRWIETHLRQYDFYAAQRVDRFVTNSEVVARRIRKFYRRSAAIIPPPVQIQGSGEAGNDYYLYVGPLTKHQQPDLAVAACSQLDRPLWVIGSGSERERLQHLAGAQVRFLGNVAKEAMADLYAHAKAVLFPCQDADFGIAPVEAMGHGIPVIASASSGMRKVILNDRTGLLFTQPTVDSLCHAIVQFEGRRFSSQACIERAREFAEPVFVSKLEWFIAQAIDDHKAHPTQEPL
ncbi:glycosyltransferase [Stenomitos frigidus]|uniref:Glycosyl transferase n=1 Tax=Stenomitos frigidus ULC18 TaxID=2107698 RepID=A0A2T1DTU3_9CYAN|nr:glycosyltransferase [Stenomitos frigidus]PSB23923.1 glycosyl transferase [Stenomitos frigidus ULC18]